jgi:hypothetical protein
MRRVRPVDEELTVREAPKGRRHPPGHDEINPIQEQLVRQNELCCPEISSYQPSHFKTMKVHPKDGVHVH